MEHIKWLKDISDEDAFKVSDRFWEHLSKHAYPLSKGTMRIPISLQPFLLSKIKYKSFHTELESLISAAKKMAEEYFHDKDLEEMLAVDPHEHSLILESKNDSLVGIVRIDLFQGEGPQVVEINADFPDGFFMHDVTGDAIKEMGHGRDLSHASNTSLFIELLTSEEVLPDDHIFIGYNGNRLFLDEFALTMIKLSEAGWKNISVGAFEDLEFKNGVFFFDGKKVNVIRRGAELSKLRTLPIFLGQLRIAKQKSGLKIINNFKMRLLGHKSLLAALHDDRFQKYLTVEERKAVKSLVPFTKKFRVSDIQDLENERNRWVLKPSDLAEGNGVSIGSMLSNDEWVKALRNAAKHAEKWIIQEKVTIPKETFTILDSESRERHHFEAYYDLDPHIVLFKDHSKLGNIIVRFSGSEILNVMKGGGLTYAFFEKN